MNQEDETRVEETDDQRTARLFEELEEDLDGMRELFDSKDFMQGLMAPLEVAIPMPEKGPIKIRFCRLSSAEIAEARAKGQIRRDKNQEERPDADFPQEEVIWTMIAKAHEGETVDQVREFILREMPNELSGLIVNFIAAKARLFFPQAAVRRLLTSLIGLSSSPSSRETL